MSCRGICNKFKIKKPKEGYDAESTKYCSICGVFTLSDSIKCQCCGHTMRRKARSRRGDLHARY